MALLKILFYFIYSNASVEHLAKSTDLEGPAFEHKVTIDVHIPSATSIKKNNVFKEVKLAQKIWAQCSIAIKVRNVFQSNLQSEVALDFETLAFSKWRVSEFEKIIFNHYTFGVPTIHYVEFLDWSYDKSGTRAISYPPFLNKTLKKIHKEDLLFYTTKMQGSSVLSSLRSRSTLAHEIGHSIFNLRHSDISKNLMIGSVMGTRRHFKLTNDQCSKAIEKIQKTSL